MAFRSLSEGRRSYLTARRMVSISPSVRDFRNGGSARLFRCGGFDAPIRPGGGGAGGLLERLRAQAGEGEAGPREGLGGDRRGGAARGEERRLRQGGGGDLHRR